ncbi:hypothetical protein ALC62_07189 [Cyphomyrmex costatus]|uniref:DNA-directed DNA polymerase n=1 Tax=Cyphomyrmex costatus TaxID=456900 RepID=A0A151IHX2_9HYME|nr:hypothetical protein ALC62_07189 [Cyphomyrmex costatus]
MERDFIEQATLLSTREEYAAWEQRCDEFIESLEEQSRIKRPRLSIGNRQSVIARLESLKDSVRGRFVHVGAGYGLRWREIETAFESCILTGAVINSNHIDPHRFLEDASEIVLERVQCVLQRYDSIKINTVFNDEFMAGDKRANKSIATRNYEIYRCTDQRSLEEFQERDSGWALSRILNLTVNANKLNPLRAGCRIKLPEEIKNKKAVINVRSMDNACFSWSVVAALHPAESHTYRTSSYPHYSLVLNLTGIEFPMTLSQIKKFENLNDITINVYAIEEGIVPIRLADQKRSKHVNLLYVEDDIAGHFVLINNNNFADELKNLAHSVQSVISTNVPMDFSPDDWRKFNSATHCHVCEKPFAKDDKRARDHCHLTGRYRGPAHSNCNLNYKDSRCIPVVFHNLTGYDAHFIIKEIATAYKGNIDLLPITKEKYISFTKHVDDTIDDKKNCIQLRFIDSYRFLASSLDKLASFLSKGKLRVLRREFSHLSEENFNLLTRKGVFPYEYIDCSEKLNRACYADFRWVDAVIIKRDIDRFDTSDYSVDNPYHIPLVNKKVPGLMKDENNGAIMTEFVGLRAKMYALRVQGKKDTKKAKGVKSNVMARSITFDDYTRCLNDAIEMTRRQLCIRSKLHEVYTISETKIALSPHDDKRYIVSGSTDTLPWGHYRCK